QGQPYLDPSEVLRRVAAELPGAVIDVAGAEEAVRRNCECLAELRAPQVVLENWRQILGRTAFVTIQGDSAGEYIRFHLTPEVGLEVQHGPAGRERCRSLVDGLSEVLGYEVIVGC